MKAERPLTEARLSVYDALGREVAVLYAGPLPAGPRAFRLSRVGLPSGVYVVWLSAERPGERRLSEIQRLTFLE